MGSVYLKAWPVKCPKHKNIVAIKCPKHKNKSSEMSET
jgi:hypothetical protein